MSADGLDNSKPSTLSKLNLPDAPPGDPPLHHVAVKYREQLEKVLAGPWLVIATGGLPSAAESIVDFPLDRLPPLPAVTDPSYPSRLEIFLKHQTQNARNELTRTNITLSAFSSLYSAVALCCEKNRPELGRQITEICDFTSDGYPGHYDGPRAYRLLVHSLTHATERTRQDKAFYETALAMQKADANHLPDHCTVEDFSKRARAYSDTIRPNLPYSVNQMDAALYVVAQLPRGLRESGRRIERDMRRTGNYADLNWVIDECKDVVRDDLKPGAEAKPNIISLLAVPDGLTTADLPNLQLAS